jgi:methylenetetrahydrofolate dehydrogenase (NAD+)
VRSFTLTATETSAIVEFSKRPSAQISASSKFNPHHVTSATTMSLADALAISDVVISAVPSKNYKVPTKDLKDGCYCVNVAGDKNFEADVRERVSRLLFFPFRLARG